MNITEFDALVKEGQLDTESILKIRDALAETNDRIAQMEQAEANYEKRISELQETNGRLYLRVTEQTGSDIVEGQKETATIDDIIKNWGSI